MSRISSAINKPYFSRHFSHYKHNCPLLQFRKRCVFGTVRRTHTHFDVSQCTCLQEWSEVKWVGFNVPLNTL